jgi:YHS domain-containing protein
MGWQFTVGEFAGGAVMIALLAMGARFAFPAKALAEARAHAGSDGGHHEHDHGAHQDAAEPLSRRLRSAEGWSVAAGYTLADLKMLRRELVLGFGIAGFLAVMVPASWWNTVFIPGNGFWTSLENAIVGPLIAIISFVCSIGNVPLAAALWKGGIGFGGVMSFIFADLITLPLLSIYRKYYGTAVTLRLLAAMWAAMSIAGIIIEYAARAVHMVPSERSAQIVPDGVSLNATTILNIAFLAVFAGLVLLHRNRARFVKVERHATDPVCGMQVEIATAPAHLSVNGTDYYFCCEGCRDEFARRPAIGNLSGSITLRPAPRNRPKN